MDNDADYPAGAFQFSWNDVPDTLDAGCSELTYTHARFLLVLSYDTWLTGPDDTNARVYDMGSFTERDVYVHRAQRPFWAHLYACDDTDPSCADRFGSGAMEAVADVTDSNTTTQEVWKLVGVDNETDTADYMFDTMGFTAPSPFFYEGGTCAGMGGRLAVVYNTNSYFYIAQDTSAGNGWKNWNNRSDTADTIISWDITRIAGAHSSDSDYQFASHPYVAKVLNQDSEHRIRMMAQNRPEGDCDETDCQIVWLESIDACGEDFDMDCASCCPGGTSGPCGWDTAIADGRGGVAIEASPSDNFDDVQHGVWAYDYIQTSYINLNLSHDRLLLFSGTASTTCGPQTGVYGADWNASSEEWEPVLDTDTATCPHVELQARHNASVIPLPEGDFKVYTAPRAPGESDIVIHYWDGLRQQWDTETSEPKYILEDSTELDHLCIGAPQVFARIAGGQPYEGAVMLGRPVDPDHGFCKTIGTQHGTPKLAWYFAELQNH